MTKPPIKVTTMYPDNWPIVSDGPLLFITNRWIRTWDEKMVAEVLSKTYTNVEVLSSNMSASLSWGRWQERLFEMPLAQLTRKIKKRVAAATQPPVLLVSLPFASSINEPFYDKNSNLFFKTVRDLGITVVLIHIEGETQWAELERIWGQLGKTIGPRKPTTDNETRVTLRFSPPLSVALLQSFEKPHQLRRFIQSRLFAMQHASVADWRQLLHRWLPKKQEGGPETLAECSASDLILAEIEALEPQSKMLEQGDFVVYIAQARDIPYLLQDIGIQRERTFRAVGEGTGFQRDIDDFDLYYHQLIIWDKKAQQLVGGYRIGCGDHIMQTFGTIGFYCSTLFHIGEGFQPLLPMALELGRSYIIPEYQRKPQPLFLLWKGILQFILQNPHYQYLFGPVSISNRFSQVSKGVMVGFLQKHYYNSQLAAHLKPRKPFKVKAKKVDMNLLIDSFGGDLANLDKFIAGNEANDMRLPVLLRQYIRQNAQFVGFNIDPKFSDCLDGFMILDLNHLPQSTRDNLQKERI